MKVNWTGVYPAVTTKFNDDDSLDLSTFSRNIEAQIDAGVEGIILGGTLGEASSLSADEKQTVLRETLTLTNGRVPIILNIAEQTTKSAVKFAEEAEKNGANGLNFYWITFLLHMMH